MASVVVGAPSFQALYSKDAFGYTVSPQEIFDKRVKIVEYCVRK
jgi:flavorubredoxin